MIPTLSQRRNLRKVAAYLEKFRPRKNRRFTMIMFADDRHIYDTKTCGTAGCVSGFGPYAGLEKKISESWWNYAYRVFGASPWEGKRSASLWNSCFHAELSNLDNTPKGAAKRIRKWLKENPSKKGRAK